MNVRQAVPFFRVSDMETTIRFYVDGLGCTIRDRWEPAGRLRWCWLSLGDAALMLQEFATKGQDSWTPSGKVGEGVTIFFLCEDALQFYAEVRERGIEAKEPFVGNGNVGHVAEPTRTDTASTLRAGRTCLKGHGWERRRVKRGAFQ